VHVAPENDFDRIAAYFPAADPDRVRAWLMRQFDVSERALPAKLALVGDELSFHFTADPQTYAALHAQIAGRRGAAAVARPRLFRHASRVLKAQLA
jgi:hypothetical protein